MRLPTRTRLIAVIALIACGLAVTFAAADSLIQQDTPRSHDSQKTSVSDIEGASGAPVDPTGDVLGEFAQAAPRPDEADGGRDAAWCTRTQRCERGGDRGDGGQVRAASIPLAAAGGGDGDGVAPSCTDTHSCVDRVVSLIPDVPDRPIELPALRECTSSIGGAAVCFDFGGGDYLVGDGPRDDGEAELGFCLDSGYYYVSGPSLDGDAGAKCPDDSPGKNGGGGGDAPTMRECTSSIGGDATCFDFGDGTYLVSDSLADGEGELGFCTESGYYYVSGPSGQGEAGAQCPAAAGAH